MLPPLPSVELLPLWASTALPILLPLLLKVGTLCSPAVKGLQKFTKFPNLFVGNLPAAILSQFCFLPTAALHCSRRFFGAIVA